ncbi:MAG TPA: PHP domain-containing protein, partial [Anaeromyxobacteraceae bacterium]|nr:PHP domain-containing protein [Anaeromyxobacteraceae bacterium]
HVVALGVPRPLTREERDGDPLAAIEALGGQAVLAHPLHPRRPFRGWDEGGPWRGMEVVSNDTSWGRVVADRDVRRIVVAALELPWDGPRAVLTLGDDPADELVRFDAEVREARRWGEHRPAARALFCSHDAHGYPSYRAAFEAFSMHVPVAPTGEDARDAEAVSAALLDGLAACVFDGIAPASGIRLAAGRDGLELAARGAALPRARWTVTRDGVPQPVEVTVSDGGVRLTCAGGCAPGDYRVEGRLDGRAWIFTNPVRIE